MTIKVCDINLSMLPFAVLTSICHKAYFFSATLENSFFPTNKPLCSSDRAILDYYLALGFDNVCFIAFFYLY